MIENVPTALDWFGSKKRMAKYILPMIPTRHTCYVEAFGGSAAVLMAKSRSKVEVYNDLDNRLVNFFLVLQDPIKRAAFYEKACLTPHSREILRICANTIDEGTDIERAWKFFVINRQSYNAHMKRPYWKRNITDQTSGPDRFETALRAVPNMASRLLKVQIECRPAIHVIRDFDRPTTFMYLDPPYVPESRKAGSYRFEMSENDHQELIDVLTDCKSMVLLSGYENRLYRALELVGWERKDFDVICSAIGRDENSGGLGQGSLTKEEHQRTECLWLNPALHKMLHNQGHQMTVQEILGM